ncbi:MAG: pilus assembly protein CpaF, partial [Propionibacteriaceae bacterium]|nr:pilus assembly protein CpaF [Propionibacteriaceae bacterium]
MSDLDQVREYLGRNQVGVGPVEVGQALRAMGELVTDAKVRATLEALRQDSVGAGILDPLLEIEGVTDVLVNGPGQV